MFTNDRARASKHHERQRYDNGGPADPTRRRVFDLDDSWDESEDGKTLADHFAGLAMSAILGRSGKAPEVVAREAYAQAAAMVEEKRRLES